MTTSDSLILHRYSWSHLTFAQDRLPDGGWILGVSKILSRDRQERAFRLARQCREMDVAPVFWTSAGDDEANLARMGLHNPPGVVNTLREIIQEEHQRAERERVEMQRRIRTFADRHRDALANEPAKSARQRRLREAWIGLLDELVEDPSPVMRESGDDAATFARAVSGLYLARLRTGLPKERRRRRIYGPVS